MRKNLSTNCFSRHLLEGFLKTTMKELLKTLLERVSELIAGKPKCTHQDNVVLNVNYQEGYIEAKCKTCNEIFTQDI